MLYDFSLYIGATLVGNWIWELWTKRTAAKEQEVNKLKRCLGRIERCIHELDYNATPGIGGTRSPFSIEAQRELLYSEEVTLLGDELAKSLKNMITEAGRSNGGSTSVVPSKVKSASKILRENLQKRSDALKLLKIQKSYKKIRQIFDSSAKDL